MQKNRLNLTDCTVGFVSRQSDGPFWGQLGCNGFIILDGSDEQRVVSKATSPFNMVRTLGFKHVESLLNALLADQPLPLVCPGQFVRLHSLTKAPQLNDQIALCFDNKRGDRYHVAHRSTYTHFTTRGKSP